MSCSVRLRAWLALSAAIALLASCKDGEGVAGAPSATAPSADAPTYSEDVAPILAAKCWRCHADTQLGGVRLNDYPNALRAARHLRHVVSAMEMPPWGVDASGTCGSFRDAHVLEFGEINTILDWVAAGAPEGPARPLDSLRPRSEPALEGVSLTIGDGYVPRAGASDFRCFVVDPRLDADSYVTALSLSSASLAVRQLTLFSLDTPEVEADARALDAASPEPGYGCFAGAGAGVASRFVAGATIASDVVRLPTGTGVPIRAGRLLVAQLDYEPFVGETERAATLTLELARSAAEGVWTEIRGDAFSLSPGIADAQVDVRFVLPADMTVAAIYPRMHTHATGMTLTAEGVGRGHRCMFDQFHWRLHTMRAPRIYASPEALPAATLLNLTCRYDTRGSTAPVVSGGSIDDEDCSVLLYQVRSGGVSQ